MRCRGHGKTGRQGDMETGIRKVVKAKSGQNAAPEWRSKINRRIGIPEGMSRLTGLGCAVQSYRFPARPTRKHPAIPRRASRCPIVSIPCESASHCAGFRASPSESTAAASCGPGAGPRRGRGRPTGACHSRPARRRIMLCMLCVRPGSAALCTARLRRGPARKVVKDKPP